MPFSQAGRLASPVEGKPGPVWASEDVGVELSINSDKEPLT